MRGCKESVCEVLVDISMCVSVCASMEWEREKRDVEVDVPFPQGCDIPAEEQNQRGISNRIRPLAQTGNLYLLI